jgi:predicted permease
MLTGLLFGLIPAWRSTKVHPQEAVKFRARGIVGGGWRLRSLLVSIETGLSAVCLIVGGLLLHSFVKLLNVDRGFAVQHIVTVNLSLPNNRYPTVEKKAAFLDSVINHVKSLPGVTSTGISNKLPLSGEGGNNLLALENTKVPLVERPIADIRGVNPDYFPTMGIPLKSGRFFDEVDRGRKVALVSALTARNVWLGQNPVGKRLHIGADNSPLMEVVGVVGDVRGVSLDKIPSLTVYIPYWQQPYDHGSLAVRTAVDPLSISSAIRDAVHQIDPELPVQTFRRMEDIVATSVAQRQFQMTMVLLFAVAAALLAGLGIYGVVSYSVAQRTSEMGIRIALGAQRGNIARIVLGQALSPVGMGLAAGIVTSIALSRVLASLLFDIVAADPITICGVISFLGAVATAATYVPVFRATHVDPMIALRYE